jgi:hypothetical protein
VSQNEPKRHKNNYDENHLDKLKELILSNEEYFFKTFNNGLYLYERITMEKLNTLSQLQMTIYQKINHLSDFRSANNSEYGSEYQKIN